MTVLNYYSLQPSGDWNNNNNNYNNFIRIFVGSKFCPSLIGGVCRRHSSHNS
jgi:hypothetical protein